MKEQKEKALAVPCGERIRLLREQLDMNQEQLAEFLECSEVSISKIERGIHMMKNWRMIRLIPRCSAPAGGPVTISAATDPAAKAR